MKSIRFISRLLLAGLFLLAVGGTGLAGQATDNIKSTTDSILSILTSPKFQGDSKKGERRQLLRRELDQRFDWNTSARSSLGRHWAKLSASQQAEFVKVFSQFLENTYLDKFELYYDDLDHIDYTGEKLLDSFAAVKVTVTTKTKVAHPVEYRMEKAASDWKVYDVIIEGASLVKNYRDQFDEIIAKSSFDGLMADLKSKLQAH